METYRETYIEVVFYVPIPTKYRHKNEILVVLPPLIHKRQIGRPQNHNHIRLQGECTIHKICSRCLRIGHTRKNYDA